MPGQNNPVAIDVYIIISVFSKYLLTAMASWCSIVDGSFLMGQSVFFPIYY